MDSILCISLHTTSYIPEPQNQNLTRSVPEERHDAAPGGGCCGPQEPPQGVLTGLLRAQQGVSLVARHAPPRTCAQHRSGGPGIAFLHRIAGCVGVVVGVCVPGWMALSLPALTPPACAAGQVGY